jgi:hypothetical protein
MAMPLLPALAALLAAAPAALRVDPAADAQQPCAANAALAQALRLRLPGVRVEDAPASQPGEQGDLRALVRREGPAWALELRDQGGELALRRELELGPDRCGLLAETAALMVDRFLEQIRWAGRPPSIEPLPAPERRPEPAPPPALVVEPAPAPAPPASPAPAPSPPLEPRPNALLVSLGPAAWLGAPSELRAAAQLSLTARLGEVAQVGGLLIAGTATSQPVTIEARARGATSVQPALAAALGGACTDGLGLSLCASALAGARVSSGSASGALFQRSGALLWQPSLGAQLSASRRLGGRFEVALDASAASALGAASFQVVGADAARPLPSLDVWACLRLGWAP